MIDAEKAIEICLLKNRDAPFPYSRIIKYAFQGLYTCSLRAVDLTPLDIVQLQEHGFKTEAFERWGESWIRISWWEA